MTYFCGRCGDTGEILLPLSGCSDPCGCPAATGEPYPPSADTGQARETGADWAARPRRFSPEDALSVAERLGAAEPGAPDKKECA